MLWISVSVKTIVSLKSDDMALSGIVVKWGVPLTVGMGMSSWNDRNLKINTNAK